MKPFVPALPVFCLLASAFASSAAFAAPLFQDAVIGGTRVSIDDEVARSTVALRIGRGSCTGSLIGPEVIVTAAHCFGPDGQEGRGGILVFFGPRMESARRVRGLSYRIHPEYDPGRPGSADIAVIRLAEPAPAGFVPVQTIDSSAHMPRGETVIAAGFGMTRAHGQDFGVLYKITMRMDGMYARGGGLLDQQDGRGVCHGDSGGPIFVSTEYGLLLWGIVSGAHPGNDEGDNCDGDTVVTREDVYDDWVAATAKAWGVKLGR